MEVIKNISTNTAAIWIASSSGYPLAKPLIRKAMDYGLDKVIGARQSKRHNNFLDALWASLEGDEQTRLAMHFEKLAKDEELQEFFYERWREVSLSSSNALGPIMTALLYTKLEKDGVQSASELDEKIFSAANLLTHQEIVESYEFLKQGFQVENVGYVEPGEENEETHFFCILDRNGKSYSVDYYHDAPNEPEFEVGIKDSSTGGYSSEVGEKMPGNLQSHLGKWAKKLCDIGLIREEQIVKVTASSTANMMDSGGDPAVELQFDLYLKAYFREIKKFCEIVELARFGKK